MNGPSIMLFALSSTTWDGLSDGVAILIIAALLLIGLFLGYALRGLVGRWQAESIEKRMRLREEEAEADIKARLKEADISARAAVVNLKFGTVPANQNFEANLCVRLATAFIMAGLVESTAALEQENLVTLMAQLELLTQGQDLVVLIDEWDKPLSAGTDRAIEARLNSFYAWLSSLENIKFLLITGIMHYRETEVFLGPDLRDLGQEPCAPALLGLTLDEVSEIYSDYLDQATQRLNTSREVLLAQIKQHYGQNGSYSPWVLNQFFEPLTLSGELKPQWVKFR